MKALAYRFRPSEQTHITEQYVSSPPALIIVDERGDVWTLGMKIGEGPRGEYAFPVLRNSAYAGIFASRIERRGGGIRAFTSDGWKRWGGRSFL